MLGKLRSLFNEFFTLPGQKEIELDMVDFMDEIQSYVIIDALENNDSDSELYYLISEYVNSDKTVDKRVKRFWKLDR